jgi:coenzyme F420-0:L-glutamate ligase/coenzyme F420-1:gamma-L-glutamate ligase
MSDSIQLIPVSGIPLVKEGDDAAELILEAVQKMGMTWEPNDVLVVAQKIVSKSEGRLRDLKKINPGLLAVNVSKQVNKDPRLVELILSESRVIVRAKPDVLIVETLSGLICANAGVDRSNVEGEDVACLLPEDPDRSAKKIRETIEARAGCPVAVILSDTFGRPFRLGQANVAIGCSGIAPLRDERGKPDLYGRELQDTLIAEVDQLASAAGLLMKKAGRIPAVIIRGHDLTRGEEPVKTLFRPEKEDLFR